MKFTLIFVLFSTLSFSQVDSLSYFYQSKDFKKGIIYAENLKKSITNKSDFNIEDYYSVQYFLINVYNQQNNSEQIIASTNDALNFLKVKGIEQTIDFIKLKAYLANFYYQTGNYDLVKKIGDEIINNKNDNINYFDTWFADLINIRGLVSFKEGDFNKAEDFLLQAKEIYKQNLESNSLEYIAVNESIVQVYLKNNNLVKAKKITQDLSSIYKTKYSKTNDEFIKKTNYLETLNHNIAINYNKLGKSYLDNGQFKNAEEQYRQALTILKEIYTENSAEYLLSYNNLAILYTAQDKFIEAEEIYINTLNKLGKDSSEYIGAIDNLTKFYLTSNQLSKADYYNQIGFDFVVKRHGKKHQEYFNFLSSKALIKNELGDYKIALDLYDECIGLAKDLYGRESEVYGTMVSNSVYPLLSLGGRYEDAEKLLQIDYKITEVKFGVNHYKTAMCLNRLANIYSSLKQDNKSIEYNLKALQILENTIGFQNNNYATVCSSLGTQYSISNDRENALKYYVKSYNIKEKLNGKYNISNLIILQNLIIENTKIKNINEQIKYLSEFLQTLKYNLIEMNSNFSEIELLTYTKKLLPNNCYLSVLQSPNQHTEIIIASFESELLLKNLSLRNQERIKNNILKSNDTVLKQQYEQFIANKRYLTKLDELAINERPTTYEQLKTDTENLEKDITRKSSEFAEAKKSLNINWKQIQEKLKPNEVVIDIVSFNYYNKKWTDSIMYGAFVIKKDSKFPKYITLFEEKQLSVLLERNNEAHDSIQSKVINKQYSNLGISNLFLKPLEAELKNVNTIYLTPSGLAHQLNFKAFPLLDNKTFGESYDIKLIGASAQIISYKPTSIQENKNMELVLYGGIDYDKKVTEKNVAPNPNDFNDLSTRSGIIAFGYLPGTNAEVDKIKELATQNNFLTTIFKEKKATEESIKKLDSKANPFILHLATHGYFFENIMRERAENRATMQEMPKHKLYNESEDPMLRSGLILAGANKFWKNTNKENSEDDGILTAKEIANLDLSNCQLVVLSACETGLGDVNGSEGVFGLQRAFKMAGVKNIIMSLWIVPDAQTAELFEIFYAECFKGKNIPESFREAQNKMKAKYDPYYWAGFVLLE